MGKDTLFFCCYSFEDQVAITNLDAILEGEAPVNDTDYIKLKLTI